MFTLRRGRAQPLPFIFRPCCCPPPRYPTAQNPDSRLGEYRTYGLKFLAFSPTSNRPGLDQRGADQDRLRVPSAGNQVWQDGLPGIALSEARSGRELRKGGVEDFEQEIGIGQGDAERGLNANGLTPETAFADEQTHLSREFHNPCAFSLTGFFGLTVLDQLDANHQAMAPHVANDVVLEMQLSQPIQDVSSHFRSVLLELLALDHFEHGFALSAHNRVAAEGIEVNALGENAGDLWCGDDRRERHAVADALGHGHDVGNYPLQLEAPEVLACPAKASLDLVGNADAPGGAGVLVGVLKVAVGEHHCAADALDGLGDEGGDLSGSGVVDHALDVRGVFLTGV